MYHLYNHTPDGKCGNLVEWLIVEGSTRHMLHVQTVQKLYEAISLQIEDTNFHRTWSEGAHKYNSLQVGQLISAAAQPGSERKAKPFLHIYMPVGALQSCIHSLWLAAGNENGYMAEHSTEHDPSVVFSFFKGTARPPLFILLSVLFCLASFIE